MPIRFKAFAVHLAISAFIVAVVLCMIFLVWYRAPFAWLEGVYPVVGTLVAVDLVLGPLLTLILYVPGKKGLKFDLTMVGLLQIIALVGGLYVSFNSRPVYAVFAGNQFYSVNKEEYAEEELKKAPGSAYLDYSLTGPHWIGARLPAGVSERDKLYAQFASPHGGGERMMPRFYVPYESVAADAVRAGIRASEISFDAAALGAEQKKEKPLRGAPTQEQMTRVLAWLKGMSRPLDSVTLVPIRGTKKIGIVALDAASGKIIDAIGEDPWWFN